MNGPILKAGKMLLIFTAGISLAFAACGGSSTDDPAPGAGTTPMDKPGQSNWRITEAVYTGDVSRTQAFAYDASGHLQSITRNDGFASLAFEFDADGYLSKTTSSEGKYLQINQYTYSNGVLASEYEKETNDGDLRDETTLTATAWSGSIPTSISISGKELDEDTMLYETFNGTATLTVDAEGRVSNTTINISGAGDVEKTDFTYETNKVTVGEYEFNGSWILTDTGVFTYNSDGTVAAYSETENNDDGSYAVKTLVFSYNAQSNVSTIEISRDRYNSSGVPQSSTNYVITFTYTEAVSIPTPNEIACHSHKYATWWSMEYAAEYLDD